MSSIDTNNVIGLDDADSFTYELAALIRRHQLAIVSDEDGLLCIVKIYGDDFIAPYISEILDNTSRY